MSNMVVFYFDLRYAHFYLEKYTLINIQNIK